eukprot:scaffold80134_cov21-Tisochrysis_lutea.AAC.1
MTCQRLGSLLFAAPPYAYLYEKGGRRKHKAANSPVHAFWSWQVRPTTVAYGMLVLPMAHVYVCVCVWRRVLCTADSTISCSGAHLR